MVLILYYVGIILLSLLSIKDFSEKIIRVKRSSFQYYVCMVLFILINITIYTGICSVAMDVNLLQLLSIKNISSQDISDKLLWPVVIAFAYFGLGTASIPMGNKAISFYGALLGLFQGMFSLKGIDINPIEKEIARLQKETKQLSIAVDEFLSIGKEKDWKTLNDQWNDLKEDNLILEEHVDELRKASKNLEADDISADSKVEKMKGWLGNKINKMSLEINTKIRNHIVRLVRANNENQEALENILSKIGLSIPNSGSEENYKISLCRAAVFSIFIGIFLGAVSHNLTVQSPDIPICCHMLVWGLGVGLFGFIFSTNAYLNEKQGYWALVLGGLAGAIGHLSIKVMKIELGIIQTSDSWSYIISWSPQILIGLIYGSALGFITHLFRYKLQAMIGNFLLCHVIFAMVSAIIFIVIGLVVGVVDFGKPLSVAFLAIIGAAVATMAAIIMDLFKTRDIKIQLDYRKQSVMT